MQSSFTDPENIAVTLEGAQRLRDHWRAVATSPGENAATRLCALTAARNWSDVCDSLAGLRPGRTDVSNDVRSLMGFPRSTSPRKQKQQRL